MGAFEGMTEAKRGYNSNAYTEGDCIARIDRCDHFEAKQTGEKYKVTLTILAVNEGPHKVGEVVTATFSKNHGADIYNGNIKGFIAGVLGVEDPQVGPEETLQTLDPEQILRGEVCRCRAARRLSKKSVNVTTKEPNQYSVYTWYPRMEKPEILAAIGEEGVKRFFPNGL